MIVNNKRGEYSWLVGLLWLQDGCGIQKDHIKSRICQWSAGEMALLLLLSWHQMPLNKYSIIKRNLMIIENCRLWVSILQSIIYSDIKFLDNEIWINYKLYAYSINNSDVPVYSWCWRVFWVWSTEHLCTECPMDSAASRSNPLFPP